MTETPDWNRLASRLLPDTGPLPHHQPTALAGGCVSQVYRWGEIVLKTGNPSSLPMMQAEQQGLEAIRASETIRAPRPLACGSDGQTAYLALEYLPLRQPPCHPYELGRQLSLMHLQTAKPHQPFGWCRHNFIGHSRQENTITDDWATFWKNQRLRPMLIRCKQLGYHFEPSDSLLDRADELLSDHTALPSLLHGDLWTGNAGSLPDGTPVLFDPAVYRGDREADLAMTELFGSFGPEFWRGVEQVWPLAPGYSTRRTLYNLYHILNHVILFGSSYTTQARHMIRQLMG